MGAETLGSAVRDALRKAWWIGLGGFLGANARYWLGGWVQARWGATFPWGTFVINVTGSFLLGFFMTLVTERFALPQSAALRLVVAIGFVGAYATFSTFEFGDSSPWSRRARCCARSETPSAASSPGSLRSGWASCWAVSCSLSEF